MSGVIDDDRAAAVIATAKHLYIAVSSKRGPHVTPELFIALDDRLWLFTAAASFKVKRMQRDGRVGILVTGSSGSFCAVRADATVLDVARPLAALASGRAFDVPRVSAAFAAAHTAELAGNAADLATGEFGVVPGRWVLVAIEPTGAIVGDGKRVEIIGVWDAPTAGVAAADLDSTHSNPDAEGDSTETALDALPAEARAQLDAPTAVFGWATPHGPVAMPVGWNATRMTATIPSVTYDAAQLPASGMASVTVDEWLAPGAGGKRGVLLRGTATAVRAGQASVEVGFEAERAVAWNGADIENFTDIRHFGDAKDQTADISDPITDPKKETRAG